ncbi:hypothetical protein E2C01_076986 [Portunus trituberculatus]|uniref:Uncharacterized protein n=1 Tax=Portunus trituberculatus TaxID=210409 RepID=A0A5B7IL25_PORTR|nr:hypothetical protein [Portunus trituberculatus]
MQDSNQDVSKPAKGVVPATLSYKRLLLSPTSYQKTFNLILFLWPSFLQQERHRVPPARQGGSQGFPNSPSRKINIPPIHVGRTIPGRCVSGRRAARHHTPQVASIENLSPGAATYRLRVCPGRHSMDYGRLTPRGNPTAASRNTTCSGSIKMAKNDETKVFSLNPYTREGVGSLGCGFTSAFAVLLPGHLGAPSTHVSPRYPHAQ